MGHAYYIYYTLLCWTVHWAAHRYITHINGDHPSLLWSSTHPMRCGKSSHVTMGMWMDI